MHSQSYFLTKSGRVPTSINNELVPIKAYKILGDGKTSIIHLSSAQYNYEAFLLVFPMYVL